MSFIISGETDKRIEEGVQPAQSAPEGELPDEENLNQGPNLEQSRTVGRTPEQEERNLDEAQSMVFGSVTILS